MVFESLFNFFSGKKQKKAEGSGDESQRIKAAFERVKGDIERIERYSAEISATVAAHHNQLKEQEKEMRRHEEEILRTGLKISEHAKKFDDLESMVIERKHAVNRLIESTKRLNNETPQLITSKRVDGQDVNEIIWDSFTPQERKIIGVFMENRDMPLSYADVGKVLGKSPSTIKNQIKGIELKGKIFEEKRDGEQRKRYSIKGGLRLNKSLD